MSDFYTPTMQNPVPCDFGPFAGGYCGKVITIDFNQATSEISIANLEVELFETSSMTIKLSDLVSTIMPIQWDLTKFSSITNGTINFDRITTELIFTPDQAPTVDRTVKFLFTVYDTYNYEATGEIIIHVIDKTPELTVLDTSMSGNEDKVYTLDIKTKVTALNTTVNYLDNDAVKITVLPNEGTATLIDGILTFTPDSTININRNVNIKYQVKDVSGIIRIGNLTVALTDITPALTTTNFTKSVLDSATLTGNITSNITIKNDTFKSLTFETPSEGKIVVNGASYTFTPGTGIKTDRVILVKYTVTSSSGLVSTSTITINVTYDNLWLKTFWYGNFLLHEEINQEAIEKIFQSRRQTNYKGTVTFIEELGKYKYIAYPKSWGITPKIVDSNMFPVAGMEEPVGYVTVEGIELVLFKTYNKINGPLTITIS